ncbi:flagellar hook-associated protein FlgK [Novosphingobium sp.]|uniref:flagellar hook-associated protein FlgK n=1 Tax=Novosphingobium sp. TaxID=1874826 RepID=UPI003D0C0BEE
MTSNLLSIASSGAKAAEIALDITGQNIANASTAGYVRRSASMTELASPGTWSTANDVSLSGVIVSGVVRNADSFLQSEARRTGSDTAQATATVAGLTGVETAVEDSGVFTAIGTFTNSLKLLAQNPADTSLRATVIQNGTTMAGSFQIAAQGLSAAQAGLQGAGYDGVRQVNTLTSQLATINTQLSATAAQAASNAGDVTTSDRASLLDQRDSLLDQVSQYANIATTFQADGSVNINIGGVSGPPLVTGSSTNTLTATTNSDGTVSLTVGNAAVTLGGGSIAGNQAALTKLGRIGTNLDSLASSIATTVNTQQANGTDLTGAIGTALFSGTTAATLAMTTSKGSAIATAAAGSAAGSTDATNLTAMQGALATLNPSETMNAILTDISGSVQSATTTQATLQTLSTAASSSLSAQAGVDLNSEAINLVKFQQAFQASSKVMQTASTIFDSILNLTA